MKYCKKSSDLKLHFRKRLFERYGLLVNKQELRNINILIKSGKAKHILTESCSRSHFLVEVKNTPVYVVYNKNLHTCVTALNFIKDDSGKVIKMKYEN